MKCRIASFISMVLISLHVSGMNAQDGKPSHTEAGAKPPATIHIQKQDRHIHIRGQMDGLPGLLEIRFTSDRNQSISSYHEVSSRHPDAEEIRKARQNETWDIFYPVVDIVPTGSMQGVAGFNQSLQTLYSINGMLNQALFIMMGSKITLENEYLLNWENSVYIESEGAQMTSFYLTDQVEVTRELDLRYDLLSASWSGEVAVYSVPEREELARVSIDDSAINPAQGSLSRLSGKGLSRERLIASLVATLHYTMGSQDKSTRSKTRNGLCLFYDMEAETYRRPTWIWGWGPSIKLLIESAQLGEVVKSIPRETLLKTARDIGETSLEFQELDPDSPAQGIIMSRWSENRGTLLQNYGYEEYYSIADAQFLAGWGWIPLYKATGDERYLEGARLLTETTGKLTREFDIIPMDYMVRAGKWKEYALNEQGFGTEGINELYQVDPQPSYQKTGDEYMKMLLKKFDSESGIWNRRYNIPVDERVPTAYHTRGVGWAMEGLLAVYELTGDVLYLEKAKKMGRHLVSSQLSNGSWSYDFHSMDEKEISEKGTALWSLLFYKLYDFTGDPEYLSVARKALTWCLDNQYDGPDLHAHGGLVGLSRQSGVVYRHWFPLTCSYTSGFFGLAVLEELKIQE